MNGVDYAAVFRSTPDAILVANDEGKYVAANPAACEMFGLPLQQLLGKRVTDFVRPEDLVVTHREWDRFRAERAQTGQFPLRRPDGQTRMLEYSAAANFAPGLHLSVLRDVTPYTPGRAGFRPPGERRRWARALAELLGLDVRSPARYVATLAIVGAATALQWLAWPLLRPFAYFLYFPAVTLAIIYGVPWLAMAGSMLLAQAIFVPAGAHAGDAPRLLIFALNALLFSYVHSTLRRSQHALREQEDAVTQSERTIASLRKAEAALKQREEELRREAALREQLVAGLSHDLRTPLSAAKVAAMLAARHPLDEERVRVNAERIIRNVGTADALIRDLLDASRVRAGERLPLDRTACDLVEVTRGALEELAAVHGDRFVLQAPQVLPGHYDCNAIRRVIENLAGNAVKYGSPGTPIEVRLGHSDGWLTLAVKNDGPPIPPGEQARLFDPYQRGKSAVASGRGGWGIGLTLVKGVAEAHGGTVSLESGAQTGTVFTLRIPAQPQGSR